MKQILTLVLLLLLIESAYAQRVDRHPYGIEIRYEDDSILYSHFSYSKDSALLGYSTEIKINNQWLLQGAQIEYFKNGTIQSIKYYNKGREVGIWTIYYENGQKAIQVSYLPDSCNLKCNVIEYSIGVGSGAACGYCHNIPSGEWIQWFENGNLQNKKFIKNGFAVGQWTWYWPNGTIRLEGSFCNAENLLKDCTVKIRTEDQYYGESLEGLWHLSLPHGEWKEYNPDGAIHKSVSYDKGKRVKEKIVNPR